MLIQGIRTLIDDLDIDPADADVIFVEERLPDYVRRALWLETLLYTIKYDNKNTGFDRQSTFVVYSQVKATDSIVLC